MSRTAAPAELVWEDPNPDARQVVDLGAILTEIRANPDRWARVLVRSSKKAAENAANRIRAGQATGWQDGDDDLLEVTVAPHRPDGAKSYQYAVYIRASETPAPTRIGGAVTNECEHCEEKFDTPGGLKHHMKRRHPDAA